MYPAGGESNWVIVDFHNPAADSDDDNDRCVLSLPTTCSAFDYDHDHHPPFKFMSDHGDDEEQYHQYLYEAAEDVDQEDTPLRPPPSPLSGMFHRPTSDPRKASSYAAFDTVRGDKQLIPDPAFSTFPEKVTVLASTRGLVFLRGGKTGLYYVMNPVTFKRARLPYQNRDHDARGEPAFVITFDEPRLGDSIDHYRVVVAFKVHDGVCAFESFSSRTWEWTVGAEICAVKLLVPESGVGVLDRAFWRTTIGSILCYKPETGHVDLIPAPQEVETQNLWEIGEMEDNLCVVCMDKSVSEVLVLYFIPENIAGEPTWTWAGQFDVGSTRNCQGARLLRSQSAAEVVMWCPRTQLVLAMDFDGRVTRTIGPLSGYKYDSDFVPYVSSSTEINRDQMGDVLSTMKL